MLLPLLLYVALTVYGPALTLLLGRKLSPVPVPVPATKVGLKLEVWSVPVPSTTVHIVPSVGLVTSVEPFARARKKTGVAPLVTGCWLGVTVIEVTPWSATVTVVDPEHAEQLPALAEMVDEPIPTPVTWPELCPTVTAAESLDDHVTPDVMVFWLPSL